MDLLLKDCLIEGVALWNNLLVELSLFSSGSHGSHVEQVPQFLTVYSSFYKVP